MTEHNAEASDAFRRMTPQEQDLFLSILVQIQREEQQPIDAPRRRLSIIRVLAELPNEQIEYAHRLHSKGLSLEVIAFHLGSFPRAMDAEQTVALVDRNTHSQKAGFKFQSSR